MPVITIPRSIAPQDDLVVVPRREYESLVSFRRAREVFDSELDEAIAEYKAGEFDGPFTAKEVVSFLRARRKRAKRPR